MAFKPRPAQQRVLAYRGGRMGVAAVPGSGKTQTLSSLTAELIARDALRDDQEVLVVTLVNSSVRNFAGRVAALLAERGLLPNVGYQVRTLHGLAHDIVRERPGLVGLPAGFQIMDERAAAQVLDEVAQAWVRGHPLMAERFLSHSLNAGQQSRVLRDDWPRLVKSLSRNFIKQAKDLRLSPGELAARLGAGPDGLRLAEMGYAIYEDYQRALAYRGAVDFDDLIRLARDALDADPAFLERLRRRWPVILEDEAQDSSQLQEEILELLAGAGGNWVRVGDPNQAIYETFTTADPQFLRDFLRRGDVQAEVLPNSGRSTRSLIGLANRLIDWTQHEHPVPAVRGALSPPHIEPTPPDDPQPNPPDAPGGVHLVDRAYSPQGEVGAIVESLERWLPKHPNRTVAVLVPRNDRGVKLGEALRRRRIPFVELLQSTVSTRHTAGALGNVLDFLADPKAPRRLDTAFRVWRRADRQDEQASAHMLQAAKALRGCPRVEAYLWPQLGQDWLEAVPLDADAGEPRRLLDEFRGLARRWLAAALLPVDQLVLTLGQDLFREPAELALAHKLALLLKRAQRLNPAWRLPELSEELKVIATNERRFLGFSDDDLGFDPEQYKGTVLITTMHRAKGLEWDRVYLMSVNNYDFPSAVPYDQFLSERWFVRDGLNLEAEALAELNVLHAIGNPEAAAPAWAPGEATRQARLGYAAERVRLLYVGITRAKRELVVTWNTGRRDDAKLTPALPLVALQAHWAAQSPQRKGAG